MDCLFCRCSVYDARVSLFSRPTSLVSHLPSISVHSVALTTPDYLFAFVRNQRRALVSSKFSWRISCEGIATKQSHLKAKIQENRQRRYNAMKHFLLQECSFSSSEITILLRRDPGVFRKKSIDSAHQVLQMLRDCGFTEQQVRKIIVSSPNVLGRSVDYLKPPIEYLKTLGIAEEDLNYIVSRNPRILYISLDKTLVPNILFLTKFFGSKDNLFKALRRAPRIATCDVELANNKLKILENAGLLEHEIRQILAKKPQFLCSSVDKIEKNIKFLTCTLGLNPDVVVKYPIFLDFSVERRMRPRYKVFQYLNSSRSRRNLVLSLMKSEGDFTKMFLSESPEVKMLYEKYKGKTGDVEVPELLPTHQR